MSGIQKLHLEDVWEDSPQTRSLINLFEKDSLMLHDYTRVLHNCCQRVQNAQTELSAATRDLSNQLKTFENLPFPLMNDNSVLKATLSQFTVFIDELSSIQQILASQLTDSMMYPISRFLQADMEEISNMSAAYQTSSADKEQAMIKFYKLPLKKESEKQVHEADIDVFLARKKYHKTALHYSAALNALQYKRSFSFIEPLLGFIHSQKSFFEMGSEVLQKEEIKEFLNNIHSSIEGVQEELTIENQNTVECIEKIEEATKPLYHIEQQPNIPGPVADLTLTQKAGYLNLRNKTLFSSSWEINYFFTQGGNLMSQAKDEMAGHVALDLNDSGMNVSHLECDNRRFVFQVHSTISKKGIVLQAESERDRDEWMATLNNIINDEECSAALQTVISTSQSQASKSTTSIAIPPSVRALIRDPNLSRSGPPPTPPSTPADESFMPSAPIQFDIITPSEERKPLPGESDGPANTKLASGVTFNEKFDVWFLGSMRVENDRGNILVQETIRQIMKARASHNMFKMSETVLNITEECLHLLDPDTSISRSSFELSDLSFWTVHPDNPRLLAFICRSRGEQDGIKTTFNCYVFERNQSAEKICDSISTATQLAFQALMERKSMEQKKQKEKEVLLQNIDQLADQAEGPQFSDDGQYLMLDGESQTSAEKTTDTSDNKSFGDNAEGDCDESEA